MKYNKQSGAMGTGAIIVLAILAILLALIGVGVMSAYSAAKWGNVTENGIVAIRDNNKNIYANGTNEILELVDNAKAYKTDLQEVIIAEIQGKYGPKGSGATVQFLQDRNIPLTPELRKEVGMSVKKFHAKFEANQTKQIEAIRVYKDGLGEPIRGFWLRLVGYPKLNLADFEVVTSDLTEETYKTKRAAPLKLN